MSSVIEIEAAIAKLGNRELAELSSWWEKHVAAKASGDNLDAIVRTSGCMAGEDGESFAKAVAAAGQDDMTDLPGW